MNSSRRLAEYSTSTALDCSTTFRIEDDTSWQVQASLFARYANLSLKVPRTADGIIPYSKYEIAGFDFTTARSVAKLARFGPTRLSLPVVQMDPVHHVSHPIDALQKVSKSLEHRSSISTRDIRAPHRPRSRVLESNGSQISSDEAKYDLSFTNSFPHVSDDIKKTPKTTRAVLQDKIPPRRSSVRRHTNSVDDSRKMKVSSGFQSTISQAGDSTSGYEFMVLPLALTSFGPILKGINMQSPLVIPGHRQQNPSEHVDCYLRSDVCCIPGSFRSEMSHDGNDSIKDAPGPNTESILPRPDLQSQTSESPPNLLEPASTFETYALATQSNVKPASLLSAASKIPAYRHALLKPSVSPLQPLDMGLPVQPALTTEPIALVSINSAKVTPITAQDSTKHSHNDMTFTPVAALAENLTYPRTGDQVPKNVLVGVGEACKSREHDVGFNTTEPLIIGNENGLDFFVNPLIEEYWGRNTDLNDSVDFAIKTAIRKVIHHAGFPSEADLPETSRAYKRLVAESLAEAIRKTDEYLERSSFWNSPAGEYSRVPSPHTPPNFESIPLDVGENVRNSDQEIRSCLSDHALEQSLDRSPHTAEAYADQTDVAKIASGKSFVECSVENSREIVPETRRASPIRPAELTEGDFPRKNLTFSQSESSQLVDIESTILKRHHHRPHWLRELIIKGEKYSPKLTPLPPRIHRRYHHAGVSHQSQGEITVNDHSTAESQKRQEGIQSPETFTKTIDDLEQLLNEALYIARLATGPDHSRGFADLLEDTATVLHRRRSLIGHEVNKRFHVSVGSFHESLRNFSDHSGSETASEVQLSGEPVSAERPFTRFASRNGDAIVVIKPEVSPLPQVVLPVQADSSDTSKPSRSIALVLTGPRKVSTDGETLRGGRKHSVTTGLEDQQRPPKPSSNGSDVSPKEILKVKRSLPYHDDEPSIPFEPFQGELRNKREVREFIRVFHHPPIEPRASSLALRRDRCSIHPTGPTAAKAEVLFNITELDRCTSTSRHSLDGPQEVESEIDFTTPPEIISHAGVTGNKTSPVGIELEDRGRQNLRQHHVSEHHLHRHGGHNIFSLRGKHHISIDHHHGFSLSRSHKRQPIARDWSPFRKRFVAAVACISTALVGILIGIYAGEVPSIQYYIADFHHFAILGNVFMFIGLAISTFLFWPLPLLHGRKPYVLGAMTIAMPLLFPQAIVVSMQRSPYTSLYRVGLILPRAIMGFVLGFANMNFMATLTDLFGASLQSGNPHQEVVNDYDVRRHGGGMGIWLGTWTWCYMGSIGVGFLIGAWIINTLSPDWGFYVSIIIIAVVLLLNIITPEVRRSAYRRSVAEVRHGTKSSRRLAKGEVMMHRLQTGPRWWGEEVHQGVMLSRDMLRQPGFCFMALYVAWVYGQVVLVIVLLGSLMSKYYHFISPVVGLTTMSIPMGALLAVPFQKASLFSRARHHPQRTDSMTFDRRITWSSHLVRRAIFTLVLPFAGLAYTFSSGGPPTPFILPILFAGLIGFLSNLAIAECNGIIMEAFDTSDLQPGMTGRPRGASGERTRHKRTNYSSFPRVSSAFAIVQSLGFLIGAVATGVGGVAQRHLGQQEATGLMAGILLMLTVGVLCVLIRWKNVQIIPSSRTGDMDRWERKRKESVLAATGKSIASPNSIGLNHAQHHDGTGKIPGSRVVGEEEEPWHPVIIGNPSGKTRRMSILELGHLSRWSEIRRRNRLIDEGSYEAKHPNLAIVESMKDRVRERNLGSLRKARRGDQSDDARHTSGTDTGTE